MTTTRRRLVRTIKGSGDTGPESAAIAHAAPATGGHVGGIEIDGVVVPLAGEPPVARGGSWWPPHN